jgi:hypothetical protein
VGEIGVKSGRDRLKANEREPGAGEEGRTRETPYLESERWAAWSEEV